MLRARSVRPEAQARQAKEQAQVRAYLQPNAATLRDIFSTKKMYKMCKCQNSAVAGPRKKRRSSNSRVSGFGLQPVKGLMNVKTGVAAVGTVIGINQLTKDATGDEMAFLRSKEGAMYEAGAGLGVAFFFKNPWLRGVGAGLAVDGGKKYLTGEDWDGNPLAEKISEVKGVTYWPGYDQVSQGNSVGRGSRRP